MSLGEDFMNNSPLNPDMMRTNELFVSGRTLAWELLSRFVWPWEVLPGIGSFISDAGASLDSAEYDRLPNNVWVHKTATVAASAFLGRSVIIGAGADVRHCAYIRENAVVGCNAVVGNSTELKNVILFDDVQVPHYNYVGDSILGHKSHMGAGSITSNVKSDRSFVTVDCGGSRIDTGLKKFGAVLGDFVEIGCNTVLNPGCVIGAHASVYPLSSVRGFVPPRSIYKKLGEVAEKR
jgi:NDP-sugar pyrophosphorylase family protein